MRYFFLLGLPAIPFIIGFISDSIFSSCMGIFIFE